MKNQVNWYKRLNPNTQAPAVLVCFPYAGGGVSVYRPWTRAFTDNFEIIAADLPGRDSRLKEAPWEDLEAMVAMLAMGLEPLIAGRPFAFFGHSFGALLAFETARYLRRQRAELPFCLFASGREAPSRREPGRHLHNLPDDEFVDEMISRYDGIPQMLLDEPDLLALFMPAMKADLRLTETYDYVPEAPFDFPLHILSGRNDKRLTPDLLRPWSQHTKQPAPVTYFDGGHFFIRESQFPVTRYVSLTLHALLAESELELA